MKKKKKIYPFIRLMNEGKINSQKNIRILEDNVLKSLKFVILYV